MAMRLAVALIAVLLAGQVSAQPEFDAYSSGFAVGQAVLSWNHTIGAGSNRKLLVFLTAFRPSADAVPQVSGCSFGGIPMTHWSARDISAVNDNFYVYAWAYYLDQASLPSAGTYPVQCGFPGPASTEEGHSLSLSGAETGVPEAGVSDDDTTSSSTISTGITTISSNAMVVELIAHNRRTGAVATAGQTKRGEQPAAQFANSSAIGTEVVAAAGAQTQSWAVPEANAKVHILASVAPTAGGEGMTALELAAADTSPGEWTEMTDVTPAGGSGWAELTNNNLSFTWNDNGAWDVDTQRLYYMGQGHIEDRILMYYDEATNNFVKLGTYFVPQPHDPEWEGVDIRCVQNIYGHAYDGQTIDQVTGTHYYGCFSSREVLQFDIPAMSKTSTPDRTLGDPSALGFLPLTGLMWFSADTGRLGIFNGTSWSYPYTNLYTALGYGGYYTPQGEVDFGHRYFVFGGGNNSQGENLRLLFRYRYDGSVDRMTDGPFDLRLAGGGTAGGKMMMDVSGRMLYILNNANEVWEFDPVGNRWTQVVTTLPTVISSAPAGSKVSGMLWTPISSLGVSLAIRSSGGTQRNIWVYRHAPIPVENTVTIADTSGSTQTNRVISIGRPFREGEIASCVSAAIDGTPVTTQTDAKNRWASDNSLRFAIVSFVIPSLPANDSVEVAFTNQASCNNTNYLDEAGMLAGAYDFDVDLELVGAATRNISARTMLDAASFRYWLQGPIVTSVIIEDRTATRTYDVDFGDSSKALHPIFEARFYPTGNKVDVGAAVENTWASSTASIAMRDLTYSLSITSGESAPESEFTHVSFNHIGRSRWQRRFWLGTDPGTININHNLRYLTSTKAIPNFDPSLEIASTLVTTQEGYWTSSDKTFDGDGVHMGRYSKALDQAGSSPWIGLLQLWDVLYLYAPSPVGLESVLGNTDLAGRIPYHFREADTLAGVGDTFLGGQSVETRGRVVSVDARTTETLSDLPVTCGAQYAADEINTGTITFDGWAAPMSHWPSFGVLAYLLTGRYYYLEEVQYSASYAVGQKTGCYGSDYARQGTAGYINHTNVRGDAWGLKAVTFAAYWSPDGEPEADYFESKLLNNVAMFEGVQDLPITDPTRQSHWNWGRNLRSGNPYWQSRTNQQPSPIGQWSQGIPGAIQYPLIQDGSLESATSPWEENFMLVSLGLAREYGWDTNTLLEFMAKYRFQMMLLPGANRYLIEQYRYPTVLTSTSDWIQSVADFPTYYDPVPVSWRTDLDADHSYRFIAMTALAYLWPYTVDGMSGKDAWFRMKALSPEHSEFETDSPKWAILPSAIP